MICSSYGGEAVLGNGGGHDEQETVQSVLIRNRMMDFLIQQQSALVSISSTGLPFILICLKLAFQELLNHPISFIVGLGNVGLVIVRFCLIFYCDSGS